MRDDKSLSWADKRDIVRSRVAEYGRSAWLWSGVAVGGAAVVWLAWPRCATPKPLRHADRAKDFLGALWQVDAAALALSAAIVTFALATFASTRVAQMGGSLPGFARSSGLLVGVAVGLVAILACGAALLGIPNTPSPPHDVIGRGASSGAVAATLVSAAALGLVPYVIWRSLRAGDRGWLQRQLRQRIEHDLDMAVAGFIERAYARELLTQTMQAYGVPAAPLAQRDGEYTAVRAGRSGTVADIRLRRLIRASRSDAQPSPVLVEPVLAVSGLGSGVLPETCLVWVHETAALSERKAKGFFVIHSAKGDPTSADDLDRLHRQGLVAVRDDDQIWYREVTGIYRGVLLHLIRAWRRYGAAPGEAPSQDEVGLRRLTDDLEAQVTEIIERDREELAVLATEVPLSVGLSALEAAEGAGLARRMQWSLTHMTVSAIRMGPRPAAVAVRDYASSGLFMLIRAAEEEL